MVKLPLSTVEIKFVLFVDDAVLRIILPARVEDITCVSRTASLFAKALKLLPEHMREWGSRPGNVSLRVNEVAFITSRGSLRGFAPCMKAVAEIMDILQPSGMQGVEFRVMHDAGIATQCIVQKELEPLTINAD